MATDLESPQSNAVGGAFGKDNAPPEAVDTLSADELAEVQRAAVDDGRGGKVVPLGDLITWRTTAKKTAKEIAELKPKLEAAEQYIQQTKPIIDVLSAHPELVAGRKEAPPLAAAVAPGVQTDLDRRAEAYARRHDLYDVDGKVDTGRARAILTELDEAVTKAAETAARKAVEPYQLSASQTAGQANYERVLNTPLPSGEKIPKEIVDFVWATQPPELTANPQVAAVLWKQAVAEAYLRGAIKAKPTGAEQRREHDESPPIFTEPAGGKIGRPSLSDWERRAAKSRNISEKDWQDRLEQKQTPFGTVLE